MNHKAKTLKASEILDKLLKLELEIFEKEWALEKEEAQTLKHKRNNLKNKLLSLFKE